MLQQYWAEQTLVWRSACAPSLFGASGGIRSAEQFGLDPKIDFAKFQANTDRRLLMRNYMAFFVENLQYYLQVCRGYDRLFRYLTTVRRTQLMLQQYWAEQTLVWRSACAPSLFGASGGIRSAEQFGLDPKIDFAKFQANTDRRLLMRNYMAFFVENLQYYLQVSFLVCHFQSDQRSSWLECPSTPYGFVRVENGFATFL
ncbi:hypothetical protein AHF37_06142 [Paragonimus kellicotti]|nr:hypothetical protein AHF37_06142 [Paragonimus kellicotti]